MMINLKTRGSFLISLCQVHTELSDAYLRNKVRTLFIVFLLASDIMHLHAQNGPGGVGTVNGTSSLTYWIDANRQALSFNGNLTELLDRSGNNVTNTIIGTPLLVENNVNQRNAIRFNGLDQQILTNAYVNAALHPELTIIAVYRPAINQAGSVWGEYQIGWEGRYLTDNGFNSPRTYNFVGPGFEPSLGNSPSSEIAGLFEANEWVISSVVFREDVPNGTVVRINAFPERAFTSNHDPGAYNYFTIGAGGSPAAAYPFWFNGDVAELVVFSEVLNDLDLLIIENYLSAKYDIPLLVRDLYTGDDLNFDDDVAGIGRIDASITRLSAQGTGIVSMEALNIGDNEFLFWGHNNGTLAALETNDIPAGVEARSERIWYVNEVNGTGDAVDVGNLNLTFQLSNLGPITASDLVLLIDTDQDGLFADETPIIGAYDLNNNSYAFQNIASLSDGSRFTFGSSNQINTPLPVSLLHFKVSILSEYMLEFTWTTATELNNDYFEIEQSTDGIVWESILKISGAGTTNEITRYTLQYSDESCNGRTYYKLSQVDEEGVKLDLQIVKVERDRTEDVFIFPNPATDFVIIQSAELLHAELYDSRSKLLKSSKDYIIDVSDLVSGTYLMHIQLVNRLVIKKLVINTTR